VAVAHSLSGIYVARTSEDNTLKTETQGAANVGRRNWYALQVTCRKELSVAAQIEGRGVECFLPTYKSLRKWSDRTKEIQQALFPGYLFSRFAYEDRQLVVAAPGVLQVVGSGKVAIPVPDSEIEALQVAMRSEVASEPWPYLRAGERVKVNCGRLSGLEGILINFKGNHRVVLSVTLLQRSLALEVDLSWVTLLEQHTGRQQFATIALAESVTAEV
jgi:transcription antitermination factor NusG